MILFWIVVLLGLALPAAAMDVNGPLTRADLENLSADPSLAASGRIYLNTTSHKPEVRSNSAWLTILDTTSVISGQTLTGDTVSNYIDVTEQASAPSSPSSSTLRVYAKTDDKLYTLNSSGVETAVGSGSGEKNYLSKGTSTAAGWTSSDVTKVTCTTSTTNLPDASVGTALAVTGQSGAAGTEYCFYNFDIDQADGSKVLKLVEDQLPISGYVASDFRLDVYSCTVAWSGTPATTCSGTATRLALSTDSSGVTALPALTGTLTPPPTYSTPAYASAPHLQARIGLNGASTHQMNFAQILTGPGTVVQSAVVGPAQSYTPSIAGVGTPTNVVFWYQQFGDHYKIWGSFNTGTVSAASVTISLPNSYSVNPSLVTSDNTIFGPGVFQNPTPAGVWTSDVGLVAFPDSSDWTKIFLTYTSSGSSNVIQPVFGSTMFGSTKQVTVGPLWVPISQLAGQGTVFLGQGTPAYYYCTGWTWGTGGSCTTQQGQGGVLGGATTPTGAAFDLTFAPSSPVQVGMVALLQTSPDQIHWTYGTNADAPGTIEALKSDGTNYFGAGASLTTSGTVRAKFGKYASGTTAGGPNAWSGTWYWRVFVGYPNQAQGFANVQPGVAAGLVPATGLPGNTTGNAAPSGYVAEKVTGTLSTGVMLAGSFASLCSSDLVIPKAGVWLIVAAFNTYSNGNTTGYARYRLQNTTDATTVAVTGAGDQSGGSTSAGWWVPNSITTVLVTSGSKTLQLQGEDANATGTITANRNGSGIDSQNEFYAIRIY